MEKTSQLYKPPGKKDALKKSLEIELKNIEKEISMLTQGLFQAQKVKLKSMISNNNNWFKNIQKEWVLNAADKSAAWHSQNLLELIKKRQRTKLLLDKVTGNFWKNRLINMIKLIFLVITIGLLAFLFFISVITFIYLLPIIIGIIMIYYLLRHR